MSRTADRAATNDEADPKFDDLLEELAGRLQAGEPVDLASYARRYPGRASEIRRLLPALEMLADLGRSVGPEKSDHASGGAHPIGVLGEPGGFPFVRVTA